LRKISDFRFQEIRYFTFPFAGMQALILQIWGEKESRGFISGYHFAIALGAFLAPIIGMNKCANR